VSIAGKSNVPLLRSTGALSKSSLFFMSFQGVEATTLTESFNQVERIDCPRGFFLIKAMMKATESDD
jgi:hypothetical protein